MYNRNYSENIPESLWTALISWMEIFALRRDGNKQPVTVDVFLKITLPSITGTLFLFCGIDFMFKEENFWLIKYECFVFLWQKETTSELGLYTTSS